MAQPINLRSLIKPEAKLCTTVEYANGIKFNINYISRSKLQNILRSSSSVKWTDNGKGRQETVDPDKFRDKFISECVNGWEGVTPESLNNIVPMDSESLAALSETERKEPIPFSADQMKCLFEHVYGLEEFLQAASTDVSVFQTTKQEEEKNSESSPSGN